MPPMNRASWITAPRTIPFKADDAPYKPPGPNQVVIKNGAVAINQYDWVLPFIGPTIAGHLQYPFIFGSDVVGTVVEVGPGVTRFRVGDRVFGMAVGIAKDANDAAEGGFQLYPVLREHMIAPMPTHIPDERAYVLGPAFGTAAYGLFHRDYLALDIPDVSPSHPADTERPRAVLIAGGASSVDSNAIQLCVSAGYEVITTCSPKNFAHVKKLGAVQAVDYHSPTLAQDLTTALEGHDLAGSYAMGDGTIDAFTAVIRHREKGSQPAYEQVHRRGQSPQFRTSGVAEWDGPLPPHGQYGGLHDGVGGAANLYRRRCAVYPRGRRIRGETWSVC